MTGLLLFLFNGLLLFPSNTNTLHNNATSNEVQVNQHHAMSNMLNLCNLNNINSTSIGLNFSVDQNKQVHIHSVTGTQLDSLALVRLEQLLQTQVGCLPVDQPISISLNLDYPEKKIS